MAKKYDSYAPSSSYAKAALRTFSNEQKTKNQIKKAGLTDVISWETYTFFKFSAVLLAIGAVVAYASYKEWTFALLDYIIMVACFSITGYPNSKLNDLAKKRTKAVNRELADTLDLLVACVEAGQALPQAMLFTAKERPDSVLSYEFSYGLDQMDNGRSFQDVLTLMGTRIDSREFKLSLGAMKEGLNNGSPLGPILTKQSEMVREMRKQAAHEWATKIPVKLTVPLVFCIFPAIFIVILGPAVIRIMDVFLG